MSRAKPAAEGPERGPRRGPSRTGPPGALLETFENPAPGRDYEIVHTAPEFTSVCPMTGQPDFGTITVRYVPDRRCVELKSLKLYFFAFRDLGIFYEAVVNRILDDLAAAVAPRRMEVRGEFRVRGGISSTVTATFPFDSSRSAGLAQGLRPAGSAGRPR